MTSATLHLFYVENSYMKYLYTFFLIAGFTFVFPFNAAAANVSILDLPEPILTQYNQQQLEQIGCEVVQSSGENISVPRKKPYYVATQRESLSSGYTFCSKEAYSTIFQANKGRVAGCSIGEYISAGGLSLTGCGLIDAYESWNDLEDGDGAIDSAVGVADHALGVSAKFKATVIYYYSAIITVFANIALFFTKIFTYFISYFLGQGSFITHPFVARGWIVIQGLTNLGFILALLFIAGSTILKMDIAGAISKLLPRLLLAALLINFSLVVGGALIDISRILMAIEVNTMSDKTKLDQIAADILSKSGVYEVVWTKSNNKLFPLAAKEVSAADVESGAQGWNIVINIMIANILVWFVTIGLGVVAIFLFIRHVALLLLLIASPIAYLAAVFPKTSKFTNWWWSEFLKYVFMGPIILFFLILIPTISGGDFTKLFGNSGSFLESALQGVVTILLTIGTVIGATIASKKLGTYGANGVIDFASKQGKRAAYHGSLASLAVGGTRLAGKGAAAAGRGAGNIVKQQSKDFIGAAKPAFMERTKRALGKDNVSTLFPERDDKGKLKPGQDSLGAKLGRKLTNPKEAEEKKKLSNDWTSKFGPGYDFHNTAAVQKDLHNNSAFTPAQLGKTHNIFQLKELKGATGMNGVETVAGYGKAAQIKRIVNNKYFVKTLKDDEKHKIERQIEQNDHLSNKERAEIVDQLFKTLES